MIEYAKIRRLHATQLSGPARVPATGEPGKLPTMTLGRSRMRTLAAAALAICLNAASIAHGQPVGLAQSARSAECMALARGDPDTGHKAAQAWRAEGGGIAARHCMAMALLVLGRYAEADRMLRTLADKSSEWGP